MDYFKKTYKSMCKTEFGEYGFKSYHNNFYRVVNDVYQSFELDRLYRSKSWCECRINYCIIPLCYWDGIDKSTITFCDELGINKSGDYFDYDRHSEEDMNRCILEIIGRMKEIVIPLFEKRSDCKSICNAHDEVCRYHYLQQIDTFVLIYAILKAKRRDLYDFTLKRLKRMRKTEEIKLLIEWLSKKDMDSINNFIETNERNNLISLGMPCQHIPHHFKQCYRNKY